MESPTAVDWPAGFAPHQAQLAVDNELLIPADVESIWAWLIRPRLWPAYYRLSSGVRLDPGRDRLGPGVEFRWRTLLLPIHSVVRDFNAPRVVSWMATSPGISAYHVWILSPEGGGTRVRTIETQRGTGLRFFGWVIAPILRRAHDAWLRGLREASTRPAAG